MSRVYAQVMGDAFAKMPAPWRAIHGAFGTAHGQITVILPRHRLLRLIARMLGFPPACTDAKLTFETESQNGTERWDRCVGMHKMSSRLWATREGKLAERLGPVTTVMAIAATGSGVQLILVHMRLLGLPLPGALCPRIEARDWVENDRYNFRIAIYLPVTGARFATYHGWLASSRDRHVPPVSTAMHPS